MYIDPGTGSVLFQIVLAGILSIGVIIRVFWKKIRSLFYKKEFEVEKQKSKEI
ncbi:MAG: hypothetical protein ABFD50_00765 [Smithella sp.]